MKINGKILPTLAVFPSMMTVPDCIVTASNKLGHGHGEAKFYIGSKPEMYDFYGKEKFSARCFMLRSDLAAYLYAIKNEYFEPSQNYAKKEDLPDLWNERMKIVENLDDVIYFNIYDQYQIEGPRGYVNSNDMAYKLLRQIALPLVSYVYVEKVGDEEDPLFYWKLFVDFDAIWERKSAPLVFNYGTKENSSKDPKTEEKKNNIRQKDLSKTREGQVKYREQLLEQCRFCPFTKIADERLLIASHIKPWAASSEKERVDPYNGFIFSPLYDKLFDRGFITFTENRHIILSDFISPYTWKLIGLKNDTLIQSLPMDEKRKEYLKFHHQCVFKGSL